MSTIFPDTWGEGALFAQSGYDCRTEFNTPFVGRLLKDRIGADIYCLKEKDTIPLDPSFEFFIESDEIHFNKIVPERSVIAGDMIVLGFKKNKTIHLTIFGSGEYVIYLENIRDFTLHWNNKNPLISSVVSSAQGRVSDKTGSHRFDHYKSGEPVVIKLLYNGGEKQPSQDTVLHDSLVLAKQAEEKAVSFYEKLSVPKHLNARRKSCYAKAVSVLRLNVESAQGKNTVRWTTPDKYPHRQMWIWDSAFHALGWKYVDKEMAYECLKAVLEHQRGDGFIPITMNPFTQRDTPETQPPILGWAFSKVADFTTFPETELSWFYERLDKFITWIFHNRTLTGSGLLGWFKQETSIRCRSGESGWDNSTRFDHPGPDDAVDLVSFVVNEIEVLERMALALGKKADAALHGEKRDALVRLANQKMWCAEDELYYDLDQHGKFVKVKTAASLLPLVAGIPDEIRAKQLLKNLKNRKLFWTKFPVPSVSPSEPAYEKDMWRGPTWVNTNYLICEGLRRYGFNKESWALAEKTIAEITRWYEKTGVIMEYYDSLGAEDPRFLLRKASRTAGVRVIRDYGWTAALYIALAQEYERPGQGCGLKNSSC